jgi:anti-sigma regulatory factor (Ser/Thr protein kinase)
MALRTDPVREGDRPNLELTLERNLESASLARAAIVGFCEGRGLSPSKIATLTLLVSELVTNAVLHPEVPGTVGLRVQTGQERVRIEVSDPGHGFTPRPGDPERLEGGGLGLYLVQTAAARWGVVQEPHTTVWFEVDSETQ